MLHEIGALTFNLVDLSKAWGTKQLTFHLSDLLLKLGVPLLLLSNLRVVQRSRCLTLIDLLDILVCDEVQLGLALSDLRPEISRIARHGPIQISHLDSKGLVELRVCLLYTSDAADE